MEAHDILRIIKCCVNQRFTCVRKVDCDPKVTAELRGAIPLTRTCSASAKQDDCQQACSGKCPWPLVQTRCQRNCNHDCSDVCDCGKKCGLGLQSARALGQHASLSAIACVTSANAAAVQGMPCINCLRAKMLEEQGGCCRLAAVTRQ